MGVVDKKARERVDIPHEPGEWIELAPLTGAEMEKSFQKQSMAVTKDLLDAEISFDDLPTEESQASRRTLKSVSRQFNTSMLLQYAVKNWSYGADVTEDNIESLDYSTREFLVLEIVKRNTHDPLLQN